MFLNLLRRRNPGLLEVAARFHHAGEIPPNCYVIDLDAVGRNAVAIRVEADRLGLKTFAMTKQVGRNRDMSDVLVRSGITHSVGVDLGCSLAAAAGGLRSGHVGHLVQIPHHQASIAASLEPLYWTVFNETKAQEAAEANAQLGRTQNLLARVIGTDDIFYQGHEGGFAAQDILAVADTLDALDGARFSGITTFPATLFDSATNTVATTPNLETLRKAAAMLRKAGRSDVEVNAPGTTSTALLSRLAEAGATQIEPGHGLTGTTPWHAVEDLVEDPAIAYISEVSHLWNGSAYVFGGGLYVDPVLGEASTSAMIVTDPDSGIRDTRPLPVDMPAPGAIDYYASIPLDNPRGVCVGNTVIFGFRAQVFVTRAHTVGISGLSVGMPRLHSLWMSDGSASLTHDGTVSAGSTAPGKEKAS